MEKTTLSPYKERMRKRLLEAIREGHMSGRIYSRRGEPETPGEVELRLQEWVDWRLGIKK